MSSQAKGKLLAVIGDEVSNINIILPHISFFFLSSSNGYAIDFVISLHGPYCKCFLNTRIFKKIHSFLNSIYSIEYSPDF